MTSSSSPNPEAPQMLERGHEHLSRRAFHFFNGTVIAVLFAFVIPRGLAMLLMGLGALFFGVMDLLRLRNPEVNAFVMRVLGPVMRESERDKPSAQFHYILGLCVAIFLMPKPIAIQCILTLAWLDPVAAYVGIKFGRRTWRGFYGVMVKRSKRMSLFWRKKTLEGSILGFFVAFVAGIFAWTGPWASVRVGPELWWPEPWLVLLMSFVGAATATLAEAWPTQWDDNVNIPFWTGIVLWACAVFLSVPMNFF